MKTEIIDSEVLVRFLIEEPSNKSPGNVTLQQLFNALEEGSVRAYLTEFFLIAAINDLTGKYKVPQALAADKLAEIVSFRGIVMHNKKLALECLKLIQKEPVDIYEAFTIQSSRKNHLEKVISYNTKLRDYGFKLLKQ